MKVNKDALTEGARQAIWERDGGKCQDCCSELSGIRENDRSKPLYCIHHIRPRYANGSNEPDNLILLCDGCHGTRESKGRMTNRASRYWYQDLPLLLRVLIEMKYGNYESYLPEIKPKRGHTRPRPRQKATR